MLSGGNQKDENSFERFLTPYQHFRLPLTSRHVKLSRNEINLKLENLHKKQKFFQLTQDKEGNFYFCDTSNVPHTTDIGPCVILRDVVQHKGALLESQVRHGLTILDPLDGGRRVALCWTYQSDRLMTDNGVTGLSWRNTWWIWIGHKKNELIWCISWL